MPEKVKQTYIDSEILLSISKLRKQFFFFLKKEKKVPQIDIPAAGSLSKLALYLPKYMLHNHVTQTANQTAGQRSFACLDWRLLYLR